MAQRTQVVFTDDMDGSEAAGTVRFSLEGAAYEVDLSQKNADKLAKALEPYIAAARKTGSTPARRASASSSSRPAGPRPQEVRAWAKGQGIEVKDKGRVPAELIVKFQAAQ